jgi:hypothetical protein
MKTCVVVPWHSEQQKETFLLEWSLWGKPIPEWLFLQQDTDKSGCAITKNRGIKRAIDAGYEIICVLDDDCLPTRNGEGPCMLQDLMTDHERALQPQRIDLFRVVTDPPSRGTPYYNRSITMPVAASMGFWEKVPDLCAPAQLVRGPLCPMTFDKRPVFGQPFPYCGMNVAFHASWWPWCSFIDRQRMDDIWSGFLFQRHAYRLNHCFNLAGPMVRHSRQSNVWRNLEDEVKYLERNETLWADIFLHPSDDYDELIKLLPPKR